jgi:hypothetical protein
MGGRMQSLPGNGKGNIVIVCHFMERFQSRKDMKAITKEHMLFLDDGASELPNGLVFFNQDLVQSLAKFQGLSGRVLRQLCL